MKVSFIIPLYNGLAFTQAMLASLRAHVPGDLNYEIIFIDDFSTDHTRPWLDTLRADAAILFALNSENLGFAATCNRGASLASGDLLVFLNNDLVLTPRWLEPMLALHGSLARPGLIGNVQLNALSGEVDHSGIFIDRKGKPAHRRDLPWLARSRIVPAVTGACFLISASLWETLGGFDESYRNGGEDIDLAFRATASGCSHAVALNSIVRHHVSASPGRKLRDEANSRRLTLRWREHLARLGTRAWCRHFLERELGAAPQPLGLFVATELMLHEFHLLRTPPAVALEGMYEAIDRELSRWHALLDQSSSS